MDYRREKAEGARLLSRRRVLAGLAVVVLGAGLIFMRLGQSGKPRTLATARVRTQVARQPAPPAVAPPVALANVPAPTTLTPHPTRRRSTAVGIRTMHFVDATRAIHTAAGRPGPRRITTIVRFPALGPGAATFRAADPLPLIVFGHGFSVTPAPYSRLLDAWAKAGYVVAAPVFPLENANAPGGPNEQDLPNQPADMSFVISRLLATTRASSGPFAGLIDPRHIAVAGQSDGGDTALATAYDPTVRDPRIGAAVILSGAEDPFAPAFTPSPDGPPLLAVQGSSDVINPPNMTTAFYNSASSPKFLLTLLGAGHQAPYTEQGPDLKAVERSTIAFLDYYFKGKATAFRRYVSERGAGGRSVLRGRG